MGALQKKGMTVEMIKKVFDLHEAGLTGVKIAQILDISETSVSRVVFAYKSAKDRNFAALQRLRVAGNVTLAEFAADSFGVLPDFRRAVQAFQAETIDATNVFPPDDATTAAPPPAAPQNDNTAAAIVKLLAAIGEMAEQIKAVGSAINAIDNRLSTMQMTQAGLRGDVGREMQKVIEAVHVEGDILTKDQQQMIDLLGGIKQNTKKRPWQPGQEAT